MIMELTLEDFLRLMETHTVEVIDDLSPEEDAKPIEARKYIGSGEDVDLQLL
jgi:hypothetical protein